MPEDTYEVLAVHYAGRPGRAAREYMNHAGDERQDVAYFFWVARNESRTVLIDCGYHLARVKAAGRYADNDPHLDPLEALARADISPEDVDDLVLSHLHLDHAGNAAAFPNATIHVARAELDFWTGPIGSRAVPSHAVFEEEIAFLAREARAGRLDLVEAESTVLPGVDALPVGGHTPGQMLVSIATAVGRVVLASDAAHFYDEFRTDRLYWLFENMSATYRTYELLRSLDAEPGVTVVPGHDPLVLDRFETVVDGIVDLTRPAPRA